MVAENALELASKEGHWVILQVDFKHSLKIMVDPFFFQNIHLVAKWLPKLEKTLEQYSQGSHESYRVYMSAEPAPTPDSHIIPQVGNLSSRVTLCT